MYIHRFNAKGDAPPDELIELLQCQMYGCTPNELDEQDPRTVGIHFVLWNEYNRLQELIQSKAQKKNKNATIGG